MKKTFGENVFICEDFSLNRKENELRRKYGIFGGSTEKNKDPQFQRQNKMDGSIGFSTTQSIKKYPETSFTFQNKFYKNFGTSHKFKKKMEHHEFKKN